MRIFGDFGAFDHAVLRKTPKNQKKWPGVAQIKDFLAKLNKGRG